MVVLLGASRYRGVNQTKLKFQRSKLDYKYFIKKSKLIKKLSKYFCMEKLMQLKNPKIRFYLRKLF